MSRLGNRRGCSLGMRVPSDASKQASSKYNPPTFILISLGLDLHFFLPTEESGEESPKITVRRGAVGESLLGRSGLQIALDR